MQRPFQNSVLRTDEPVYKMAEDVPRNANEGFHRVSYSFVDPKPKIGDFVQNFDHKKYSPAKVNSRHFHVPPCVLN